VKRGLQRKIINAHVIDTEPLDLCGSPQKASFLASTEAESRTNPKSGEEVDLGRTQGEEKDRCRDTYDG